MWRARLRFAGWYTSRNSSMNFDLSWFALINGLAGHSTIADRLGVFFASDAQYVWAAALFVLLFWPKKECEDNRIVILVSVAAAAIARLVVKGLLVFAYPRPRPFVELPNIHPLIASPLAENFQSFPSGHTIFFFALATVIYLFHKKWGAIAFIAAACIGIARIYVGVHWPTDIIGGAVLGILTGWATYRYYTHHKVHITTLVGKGFGALGL